MSLCSCTYAVEHNSDNETRSGLYEVSNVFAVKGFLFGLFTSTEETGSEVTWMGVQFCSFLNNEPPDYQMIIIIITTFIWKTLYWFD